MRWAMAAVALLLVATAVLGPGTQAGAAALTGKQSWRIAAQRTVTLGPQIRIVSMSPDGHWLAALTPDNAICFYDVTALRRAHCAKQSHGAVYASSLIWSPDSARLAFTENWAEYVENSDIWLMDLGSGALHDLTPDGVGGDILLEPESKRANALIDVTPAWSPDGKALIFGRTVADQASTSLYRTPAAGGRPTRISEIAAGHVAFSALFYGLRWLPDGRILYSLTYPDPGDRRNGLWLLAADGSRPRELLMPDPALGPPQLMHVTADGRTALVWYYHYASQYGSKKVDISTFALVDLASGATRRLTPAAEATRWFLGPLSATFSPDGAQVLYIYRAADGATRLALRATRGGPEFLLRYGAAGPQLSGTSVLGQGLTWASNGTIYVAASPYLGVLLTLRRS